MLFVLVMGYLSRVLSKISDLYDYRFYPLRKATRWTHLIFVNDLIFCKGNERYVATVMEALNHFSDVIGLVANLDTSSIFIAGVNDNTQQNIIRQTGFSLGTLPTRYLRLHLPQGNEIRWTLSN